MAWKYIVVDVRLDSGLHVEFPFIFSDKVVHADIAAAMQGVLTGYGFKHMEVVSAGMIGHIEVDGIGGKSETLGIDSRTEDKSLIENYEYAHGIRQR